MHRGLTRRASSPLLLPPPSEAFCSIPAQPPPIDSATTTTSSALPMAPTTESLVARGRTCNRFGYRFDLAAPRQERGPPALIFERRLRPGRFQLVLEVSDLQSSGGARLERPLEIPRVGTMPVPYAIGAAAADRRRVAGKKPRPARRAVPRPRAGGGSRAAPVLARGRRLFGAARSPGCRRRPRRRNDRRGLGGAQRSTPGDRMEVELIDS